MRRIDKFNELSGKSGIYFFKNIINDKLYIGQAINIRKRILSHIQMLNNKNDDCILLQRAWNKYGEENFEIGLLEICCVNVLDDKEIFYIKELESQKPNGYNISPGGNAPMKGRKHTKERNRKQSLAMMGNKNTRGRKQPISERIFRATANVGIPRGKNKTSKYVGVYWDESNNAWCSSINLFNQRVSNTYHKTEISAALDYNINAVMFYGKNAKLNKISKKDIKENQKIINKLNAKTSKYSGVIFDKKASKWRSRININGKRISLGYFDSEKDAAIAFDKAYCENFKTIFGINFPNQVF